MSDGPAELYTKNPGSAPVDFADVRRNAVSVFGQMIRLSSLEMETQKAVMAFGMMLEQVGPGQILDLQPIYDVMKEAGADSAGLEEVFTYFKAKEEQIGIPMNLPAEVQQISTARREKLLNQYRERTQSAQTYAEKNEGPAPGKAEPKADHPDYSKRKAKKKGARKGMIVALLFVLGGSGGTYYYLESTALPGTKQASIPLDDKSLPCSAVLATGPNVVCEVPVATLNAYSDDEFKKRAKETQLASEAAGYQRLFIREAESKTVHPF